MPTGMPASGPGGTRRFWVTVLCFALANLGAWIAYDRFASRRHAHLEVRQAGPAEGSVVNGSTRLWWTFNLDVIPNSPGSPPPGLLSPGVSGKWHWDDPRTLSFVPDRALPKATPITVTLLPDRLRTPDGFSLAAPHVMHFRTPALSLVNVRQQAFDEQDRLVLELEFDDDVLPSEVLAHLTLKSSEGKPVQFHQHSDASGRFVRVMTDPLPTIQKDNSQAYVKVCLSPGLGGRSGPLGLDQPFERNVTIASELMALDATARFDSPAEATLQVHFNNRVETQALRPLISVEPAVPFTLSQEYNGLALRGAFQPATRYAIRIAAAPKGTPRLKRPRPTTLSVYIPDREPGVWFEHEEGYLGSAGNRTLMAHAVNVTAVRVTVTRMYDNNLVSWREHHQRGYWGAENYGRPLTSRDIHLATVKNKTQDVRISLDDLLPSGQANDGVYQIGLRPISSTVARESGDEEDESPRYGRATTSCLVTLSDIGLTAKQGRTGITIWATSLRTANPLPGIRVRLFSNKNQPLGEATTGADGLAKLGPIAPAPGEQPGVILADRADSEHRDLTWLDLHTSRLDFGESDTTGAPYLRSGHEAFLYTDRGVYRPGETVHLRAIVRAPGGAVPVSFPVRWQFRRPDLHNWKSYDGSIDSDGAMSLDLPLPQDLPTGQWSVYLGLPGQSEAKAFGSLAFQVEDFMPNRMQVAVKLEGPDSSQNQGMQRFMAKDAELKARVQADYLFGRPVSERPARLVARIDPAGFAPSGWRQWTFGDVAGTAETLDGAKITGHRIELPEQTLDANGRASFDLSFDDLMQGNEITRPQKRGHRSKTSSKPPEYPVPWRLTVTTSVIEAGGRAVTASRQADLDLVPWYIAVRAASLSTMPDTPCRFDVRLVAPDGKPAGAAADLEATLFRETWNNSLVYESGRYVYHSTRVLDEIKKQTVQADGSAGACEIAILEPGSFVLRLRDMNTGSMTSCQFYAGQGSWEDNISRENPERLELVVQPMPAGRAMLQSIGRMDVPAFLAGARAMLQPNPSAALLRTGDTAQVIVRSPFAGRLLLSVETDDVVSTRVIDMPASHMVVPVEIPSACRPNAYITATVIRAIDPDAKWRTHRAFGAVGVPIDSTDQKLAVELDAPRDMRPSQSMTVHLRVTDPSGNPIPNAAVTLAAVDEGICQLTGFKTPDPFAFFMRKRALGVSLADLYSQLMPEVPKPDKISDIGGDKNSYDPRHVSPISAKRVKPVSLVSAVLHTDESGTAEAAFNVPQFTGKLRLMAVASAGRSFGSGEGAVLVRSPILVQSSWPRFAAPGDKFLVPLVVFNNTSAAGEAGITMRITDGPLRLGGAEQTQCTLGAVKLGPGGQSTQYVEVSAAEQCGVSHAILVTKMGNETYEEDVELPVRPPSPEIQLGGYAAATPDKPALVSLPGGMLEGTSKFEIRVTPWPSLQLPQGLDYLERYPYGCLEQTTSTLFPLVYLSDIGSQIAPGVFDKDRVADKVQVGITRLIGMQTADGGLAMWPAYREAWPWGSVYAAHFLIEAQNAGHVVPEAFRDQLLGYCRNLLNQSSDDPNVLETQAYACYVLALAGKPERPAMSRLTEIVNAPRPDGVAHPPQARFHLAAAWLASGRRDLAEGLIPQALPPVRAGRAIAGSLSSPVRERAILANTLLAVQPDHPALPELVQKLADGGLKREWRSTQDTAFAVLALGRYIRQMKSRVPYESAELFLDGRSLASASDGQLLAWNAKSIATAEDKFEIKVAGPNGTKAHVSWLEVGVPLKPPAAEDHAMKVRRRFLNEKGQPLATASVHSGDLVQVELSITSDTSLENLVVEDLLPAGLEIENPRLMTTASDVAQRPEDSPARGLFQDGRLDVRDDRLVLIGRLASAGTGTYVYTARAVTPGRFVLPPVHAECMYDNGINSLWGAGTFEVLPSGSPRIANVEERQ